MIWRVYFNRHGHDPWSVDAGTQDTECTCAGIVLNRCPWTTRTLSACERSVIDQDFTPGAWIEVEASRAELVGNRIVFAP